MPLSKEEKEAEAFHRACNETRKLFIESRVFHVDLRSAQTKEEKDAVLAINNKIFYIEYDLLSAIIRLQHRADKAKKALSKKTDEEKKRAVMEEFKEYVKEYNQMIEDTLKPLEDLLSSREFLRLHHPTPPSPSSWSSLLQKLTIAALVIAGTVVGSVMGCLLGGGATPAAVIGAVIGAGLGYIVSRAACCCLFGEDRTKAYLTPDGVSLHSFLNTSKQYRRAKFLDPMIAFRKTACSYVSPDMDNTFRKTVGP